MYRPVVISRRQVQNDKENNADDSEDNANNNQPEISPTPSYMAPESRTRAPGSPHLDPGSPSLSPPREPAVKRNPKGRSKGSLNKVQKAHKNNTNRDSSR